MLVLLLAILGPASPAGAQVTQVPTARVRGPRLAPLFSERRAPRLPFAPALYGRGVAAGDIDRDGAVDFCISTAQGAVLYMNRGTVGFVDESVPRLPAQLVGSSACKLGDVNGDAWLDAILLSDAPGNPDVLLLGDGGGGLGSPLPLPLGGTVSSDVEFCDVDLDGDLDLVRSVGASGHVNAAGRDSLLLNDGAGGFSRRLDFESAPWNSSLIPSTGVLCLDANLDGIPDLLVTRADSGGATGSPGARNLLVLGVGDGSFIEAPQAMPALEDNSYDAVALDLEGDGDLDIVVANSLLGVSGAGSGDVLVNMGGAQGGAAGVFTDRPGSLEETPSIAEAIRLGPLAVDVDLDGRTDVLFRVHDLPPGGEQPLFLGDGLDFRRGPQAGTGTLICAGGAFADIDGDGDPDLLLTSAGSAAGGLSQGRVRLFLNVTR